MILGQSQSATVTTTVALAGTHGAVAAVVNVNSQTDPIARPSKSTNVGSDMSTDSDPGSAVQVPLPTSPEICCVRSTKVEPTSDITLQGAIGSAATSG